MIIYRVDNRMQFNVIFKIIKPYSQLVNSNHSETIFNNNLMSFNEFQCIKIKDGLYLGNNEAVQDYEFLVINKFAYIVNCSAQVPNHFQSMGVKYLKFKLLKQKPHKLFDEKLKKIQKLSDFISSCEQSSMCCMITSNQSNMRSLVIIVAFLMNKFRWTLGKTLEYIRSKNVYIALNQHYIDQLQILEQILNGQQGLDKLSKTWQAPYFSEEEQIICKTYINSQQINLGLSQNKQQKKPKKEKRIVWQDKIDKEKRRTIKEQKSKEMRQSRQKSKQGKQKKKDKVQTLQQNDNLPRRLLNNNFLNGGSSHNFVEIPTSKLNKNGNKKSQKSNSVNKISLNSEDQNGNRNVSSQLKFKKLNTQQQEDNESENNMVDSRQVMKLIKNNLKLSQINQREQQYTTKSKKFTQSCDRQIQIQRNSDQTQYSNNQIAKKQPVYNLTINNYISPNIQILGQSRKTKVQKMEKCDKQNKICKSSQQLTKKVKSQKNQLKNTGIMSKNVKSRQRKVKKRSQHSPRQKAQKHNSMQLKRCKI